MSDSSLRVFHRVAAVAALTCAVLLPAAPALAQPSSGSAGSSGSSSGSGSSEFAPPISSAAGLIALTAASTQSGKPYLWGGTGPDAWDCSGLVQWAFRQAGVNLPRTTWQQAVVGLPVPLWALSPGDVIILNRDASHVGIYAGFGQVFNAYGRGVPVGLAPLAQWEIYTIRRF
ncbi:MAG TPA: NlpC/P60 family protein [Aldersonia sp.]